MNIIKKTTINKPVEEVWEVLGNQFGEISNWASIIKESKVYGESKMKQLLLVGLGGFLGSILRYGVGMWTMKASEGFSVGTTLVNLIGSLIIGFILGMAVKNDQPIYWFAVIGFCGGFTTFSTFSMDGVRLIKNEMWMTFLGYSSLSLFGGFFLCMVGLWLGRMLIN